MAKNDSNNETMLGILKEGFIDLFLKKGKSNNIPTWEFEGANDALKGTVKIYDCSKLNSEDKKGVALKNGLGIYVLGTNDKRGDERLGLLFGKIPSEATNEQVGAFFNNERNFASMLKNKGTFGSLELKTLVPGHGSNDTLYYLAQQSPTHDKDSFEK
ncbi:MAG: hypothetical protein ACM3KR_06985 [Deltaproteobacteria bacterium]